jgi:hypothetical protein
LFASIVEAHGGLDRWRRFNRVEATIVTGGAFWGMKNLTQDQDPRRMTVSLHEERASVAPFGDPDWHTEFTPIGSRSCGATAPLSPSAMIPAHRSRATRSRQPASRPTLCLGPAGWTRKCIEWP